LFDVAQKKLTGEINIGDNPNELLLTKDGKNLFVANANDNSVSIIDVAQRKVIEVLNAALFPTAPTGSASNGLALSADEKTFHIFYVAHNRVDTWLATHEPIRCGCNTNLAQLYSYTRPFSIHFFACEC